MRKRIYKILVTGGAGFIGSEFVRQLIRGSPRSTKGLSPQTKGLSPKGTDLEVNARGTLPALVIVDKLTYAGDLERLKEVSGKYKFYRADICDKKRIESIFKKEKPHIVVHFAAETHVDRSILSSGPFLRTNVIGTQVLLDVARKWRVKKLIHISSDEVYGEIKKGKFTEDSPLRPNSPYAASKASADLIIKSYIRTYNFPAIIIRPCNNYGPWQYPEKLIPLAILKLLRNEKVPVYAKGKNVREWLYVEDCANAILKVLEKGRLGQIYNIGSNQERQNIEVVRSLLKILNADETKIHFIKDRPGHDIRYKLNWRKITKETAWKPRVKFDEGIRFTVNWYLRHKNWLLSKE